MWRRLLKSLMKAKQTMDKETFLELEKSMNSTTHQLSSSGFTRLVIMLEPGLPKSSFDFPNTT